MKIFLIYFIPKKILYAVSDKKKYVKRFLSERYSESFNVITTNIGSLREIDTMYLLQEIPLEDENGDCTIIGTNNEEGKLDNVCDFIADICNTLKVNFTQNFSFNNEYKTLLDDLTTISKDVDRHQIIQIDTVKLFYYLFRNTFLDSDSLEYLDEEESGMNDILKKYYC